MLKSFTLSVEKCEKSLGEAFSIYKSMGVPPVAGLSITPYVSGGVSFDLDKPAMEVHGALKLGVDYAAKGGAGNVFETAFSPTFNSVVGVDSDSLIPTMSFMGSDPMPITSDKTQLFKIVLLGTAKKVFAVVGSFIAKQTGMEEKIKSLMEDPGKLGWLFNAAAGATKSLCDAAVDKHCWDEGQNLAAGTGTQAQIWCCLEKVASKLTNTCKGNHELSRAVNSPYCNAATAAGIAAIAVPVPVVKPGGAVSTSSLNPMKLLAGPIKIVKAIAFEFTNSQGLLAPLFDTITKGVASSPRAVEMKTAYNEAVADVKDLKAQIAAVKQQLLNVLDDPSAVLSAVTEKATNAVNDGIETMATAGAESLQSSNSSGARGAAAGLANDAKNFAENSAASAKATVMLAAGEFVARFKQLGEKLQRTVVAFLCLIGTRSEGCVEGDSLGAQLFNNGKDAVNAKIAEGKKFVNDKVQEGKDKINEMKSAVGNKINETKAAVNGAIASGTAAVAGAVGGAENIAGGAVAAAKQMVADKIKEIKAYFVQKMTLVYAIGDKIQLFFEPFGDIFASGKKIVEELKGILVNAKDVANQEKNVAYVARFGTLANHFTDVKTAINTIKTNVDAIDLEAIADQIKATRDGAVAGVKGARDDAVDAVKGARDSVVKTVTDAKNNAVASAQNAKNAAVRSVESARNLGVAKVDALKTQAAQLKQQVEDQAAGIQQKVEGASARLKASTEKASTEDIYTGGGEDGDMLVELLSRTSGSESESELPLGQSTINAVSQKGDQVINAVNQKATQAIDAAASVVSDKNIDKVANAIVSDKNIDKVANVINDGVINNITKVVGKYKTMLSGALGKASSAVNFVVDITLAVEGMLECAAIKGPKNVMIVVAEGRKGVVAVGRTIAKGVKKIQDAVKIAKGEKVAEAPVADPIEWPDFSKVDRAKKEMKCVLTSLDTVAGLFNRVNLPFLGNALNKTRELAARAEDQAVAAKNDAEGSEVIVNLRKALKIVNPALDLLKVVAELLPKLSPAAVATYDVIKAGSNKQAKLPKSKAQSATKAFRGIIRALGALKTQIASFKTSLLAAKIVAPKILAVLGTINTGIGIMIAAIDVLKTAVVDMTLTAGGDLNKVFRRRLLKLKAAGKARKVSGGGGGGGGGSSGTASDMIAVLAKMNQLEDEVATAREATVAAVKTSAEDMSDKMDDQADSLQAIVRKSGGGAGGDGAVDGAFAPTPKTKSKLGKPGSFLSCPSNYIKTPAPGSTTKSKYFDTRMIFEKRKTILKESLRVPPSMTYGVVITLSIEVEVEVGMQLEWARCERELPSIDKCEDVIKLFHGTLSVGKEKCKAEDVDAKAAGDPPGRFTRRMFKNALMAKMILFCVKGHGPMLGWSEEDVTKGLNLAKHLCKLTNPLKKSASNSKATHQYGKYCDDSPPLLEWLQTKLASGLLPGAPAPGTATSSGSESESSLIVQGHTGDVVLVVVPYMYASVLAFAVLNIKVLAIELEGSLDLELFSVHVPVEISVHTRVSLTKGIPGAKPRKPSPGLMVRSKPFIRTLNGRLVASIKIFGFSFASPVVDFTGIKLTLFELCKGMGTYGHMCAETGGLPMDQAEIIDPELLPQSTRSCIPCVPGKHNGASFFGTQTGLADFANIQCPPTPMRVMQTAGLVLSPDDTEMNLIPVGAYAGGNVPETGATAGINVGTFLFRHMFKNAKTLENQFRDSGHLANCPDKGRLGEMLFSKMDRGAMRTGNDGEPHSIGYKHIDLVALCDEHTEVGSFRDGVLQPGFIYTGTIVVITDLTPDRLKPKGKGNREDIGPFNRIVLPFVFKCLVNTFPGKPKTFPEKTGQGQPTCMFSVPKKERWDKSEGISYNQLAVHMSGITSLSADDRVAKKIVSWMNIFKDKGLMQQLDFHKNMYAITADYSGVQELVYSATEEDWVVRGKSDTCNEGGVPDTCAAKCEVLNENMVEEDDAKNAPAAGPVDQAGRIAALPMSTGGWEKPEYRDQGFEGAPCRQTKQPKACPNAFQICDKTGTCAENPENDFTWGFDKAKSVFGTAKSPSTNLQDVDEEAIDTRDPTKGPWLFRRSLKDNFARFYTAVQANGGSRRVQKGGSAAQKGGSAEQKGVQKGVQKGGSAAQKGGRRRRLLQDGGDIGVASSSSSGFGFQRRLTSNKQTPLFVEIGAQAHRARRRARSPLTREQVENLATNESISLSVAPLIYRLNAGEYCGSIETCKIHCIDNLFESTGGPFSTAKNFCKKIEKPWKCSFPTERLSPCREGLSCSAVSKCKKDTGDAQGHKPDKSPTSKATCLHNCQRNSPCTGATGFGLQQLTDFSTGMFSAQPTGTTATRVYATGVCYECKIGPDLHFRCPQIGRRRSLMELVSTHVKKTDKLTDHELLGRALSDVMHAGADVCFDKRLKGNLDLPTDKVDATLVVCNERIELPVSSDAKSFKYAGTMAVVGAFNPSFVEGFSPTDMDTRFFNFGYTVKVESGVASFPAESSDVCDVITPFDKDTSYRKKLAEVYGVYWRARNKGVSRITPCLPAPTMDFREIVSPSTGKVHYGSVQFFGVNIAINDPEIAFRSTRAAFTCSKATGAYNILSLVGIGGGADAVYCAGGEGDVPRRLAQLEDSSMPKAKDQEARNVQFDAAVAFVISLVSEYDGLNIMKASSKGEDMKWIAMTKNCDKGTRDKGFWKKLMDDHIGEANVWGVVDEAIFVNNSPSIGVVPGKPNPPPSLVPS